MTDYLKPVRVYQVRAPDQNCPDITFVVGHFDSRRGAEAVAKKIKGGKVVRDLAYMTGMNTCYLVKSHQTYLNRENDYRVHIWTQTPPNSPASTTSNTPESSVPSTPPSQRR